MSPALIPSGCPSQAMRSIIPPPATILRKAAGLIGEWILWSSPLPPPLRIPLRRKLRAPPDSRIRLAFIILSLPSVNVWIKCAGVDGQRDGLDTASGLVQSTSCRQQSFEIV